MIPENRIPAHPGDVLQKEFLSPLQLTRVAFARHIGVSAQSIGDIVRGRRRVTPGMAWRFAQAFGTTPEFWMNLQNNYDLARSRPKRQVRKLHSKGMPQSAELST
ncbi:MAG: HigA family addiction module antitoxin [Chloroflexi bacterium]|nr:HigA family addiction module antitoxin [Chloroflexota bacterium]